MGSLSKVKKIRSLSDSLGAALSSIIKREPTIIARKWQQIAVERNEKYAISKFASVFLISSEGLRRAATDIVSSRPQTILIVLMDAESADIVLSVPSWIAIAIHPFGLG